MILVTYIDGKGSRGRSEFCNTDGNRVKAEIARITSSGGRILSASLME